MIYFKGSFLKSLMISLVCISFSSASLDENLQICETNMLNVFGLSTVPKKCLRIAIRTLILYGVNRHYFNEHVTKYYETFHISSKTDKIKLPEEFCNGRTNDCYEELSKFEKYIVEANFLESDLELLNEFFRRINLSNTQSTGSTEEPETEANLKFNVLRNALYYHKQGDPPLGEEITNEAIKYIHPDGSHGHRYLEHIAEEIEVIDGLTQCNINLRRTFGVNQSRLNCIKSSIKNMKLYGENKFIYDVDSTLYYQTFHVQINTNDILFPEAYCYIHATKGSSNEEEENIVDETDTIMFDITQYNFCIEQIQIFYDYMGDEDLFGGSSNAQNIGAGSSNTEKSDEEKKLDILKNALYYHKRGEPEPWVRRTAETIKYFHTFNSYGHSYLTHISDVITLYNPNLENPAAFCYRICSERASA